jgi:glutaredoxin
MKKVVLYTMKGCPHCTDMKDMLKESKIKFSERDIDRYEKEYDLFVEATTNEYIPAFMLMTFENPKKPTDVTLLAPDRDFNDLTEALEKVRRYLD